MVTKSKSKLPNPTKCISSFFSSCGDLNQCHHFTFIIYCLLFFSHYYYSWILLTWHLTTINQSRSLHKIYMTEAIPLIEPPNLSWKKLPSKRDCLCRGDNLVIQCILLSQCIWNLVWKGMAFGGSGFIRGGLLYLYFPCRCYTSAGVIYHRVWYITLFFLGSDTLLQILYETDKQQETHDILTLHEVPAVWRYRAMISVNHLRQSLDATKQKLPVLRLFLREVSI